MARTGRRRLAFAAWTVVATVLLLELTLRGLAAFIKPRTADVDLEVDEAAFRVLALGDSWVAGAEAPDGQGFVDVFAREVGRTLAPRPVQLFNHGRPGSNSAHVALTALDEVPRVRPHVVLVLVGQNNATNFYRVAEVEQRLGGADDAPRWTERLRVVKGARIVWANLRGGSGYGRAAALPEVPPPVEGEGGSLRFVAADGASEAALRWFERRDLDDVPDGTPEDERAAWAVLYAAASGAVDPGPAEALAEQTGWAVRSGSSDAPRARGRAEVLARYALLRWARERGDWRSVRHHGDALLGVEPRDVLTDLGGAEASLLAGDWRTARALLAAAHHRAPGLADVVDLAARFPGPARDLSVDEAMEYPLRGATELDRARQLAATWDLEGRTEALGRWVEANPSDLRRRVDYAVALAEPGRTEEAEAAMEARPSDGGEAGEVELLRWEVARTAEHADRDAVAAVAARALALPKARDDAALLAEVVAALAEHELCDLLPSAAERWYLVAGDGGGFTQSLSPCAEPGRAVGRVRKLRRAWGPRGDPAAWTALVKAGRRPFDLLYRDLDLVLDAASRLDPPAAVLLLDYPNPSEDHRALRDVLTSYAADRPVHFQDQWSIFDARFDADAWQALLGPNGHCNADGYLVMGRELADFASRVGALGDRP